MPLVPINPLLAVPFSRSLMRLLRPSHLRDANYMTDMYCAVIEHPAADGTTATWPLLDLPETQTVPIHIEASGEELIELLAVFVNDGALTQQEADGISGAVQAVAGQEVRIADFIPPSWVPYVLTREQAAQAGYFPDPSFLVP